MKIRVGVAVAVAVLGACREEEARRAMSQQRIEDRRRLGTIARLVAAGGTLPVKDGMFDPYDLVRRGRADFGLFRSARYGFGPTEEEAKAGDYARFPWVRCKGPRKLDGRPFPMLWEKDPDVDGRMLVVRSDGIVAVWGPETLFRAVAEGPVER